MVSLLLVELVACQKWFCCRALAAAPLTPQPISLTFSCPWRRDGRTEASLDRKSEVKLQRAQRWKDVVMEKEEGSSLDGKREQSGIVEEWRDGAEEWISSGALWPKARQWISRWLQRLYSPCLPLFFSSFLLSSCFPYNCLPGGLLGFYLSSLSFTFSFLPQSGSWQADRGHDGRCPLRVRQHFLSVPEARSGSLRHRPTLASFSVCEVQLLCSVTPLTTPISAAQGLCKLELTTRPCFSKSAQWLCHSERATFNHISALWLFSLSLGHREQNRFMRC